MYDSIEGMPEDVYLATILNSYDDPGEWDEEEEDDEPEIEKDAETDDDDSADEEDGLDYPADEIEE